MPRVKVIVTLGPSTRQEKDLRKMKARGVDFVRVNMSHSTLSDQAYFMKMAKRVGIPFILDTEGSQIRNGDLVKNSLFIPEGRELKLYANAIVGNTTKMSLYPSSIVPQLEEGDIIYIDFNSLILRVLDTRAIKKKGYVIAQAIAAGHVGPHKAVVVDSALGKTFNLPTLSPKDMRAIALAKKHGVKHLALSFVRSADDIQRVRKEAKGITHIIAKIECKDALNNLDAITREADALLIDRGDLSKEIPIEKVPFAQKAIIRKALKEKKETYVATNLLESMVEKREPTRAEVHDIVSTILDGAGGLALSAETAIGKYPIEAINTLQKVIRHTHEVTSHITQRPVSGSDIAEQLLTNGYLKAAHTSALLIEPHGGALVDRVHRGPFDVRQYTSLPRISLTDEQYMDVEQIALGAFSPIEGFMGKDDLHSVLFTMRLTSAKNVVWPIPIVLDVREEHAASLPAKGDVALTDTKGDIVALLHLQEKYWYDKNIFAKKMYGTLDTAHPGVRAVYAMKPILLGGKITLFTRRSAPYKGYELTPRQVRRMFEERGWAKVVGFHTRNVPHRAHEFIQLEAMERAHCDGMLVHPVIGKKKKGDFESLPIIKAYEMMMQKVYPKNKVVFATYATFSRYAGPREALFTALCRKNFGCSHFIVGRDHTGAHNFYAPTTSHEIFKKVPDIGIIPVLFQNVFYSKRSQQYACEEGNAHIRSRDRMHISGAETRKMFLQRKAPPAWSMRPEISKLILRLMKQERGVFVA